MDATIRRCAGNQRPLPAISMESMEQIMIRHLRRTRLARGVAGAVSTLVLCATAAFTIARHFAL
jgi:hypothetical protein